MTRKTPETPSPADADKPLMIWGAENIGRYINRSANQVLYLHSTGALGDAVKKLGHRTLVGYPEKLRKL